VRRKWGWYLTLLDREHFKVKLLRFNMKAKLSNQYHLKRNELWLFLSGEGLFLGGKNGMATTKSGDYIHVPCKTNHEYSPFTKTLVLEIQYGEKCEEADIVRL
jgi:mannose-6-phosphate isomerase-like protein (cupin superfamily)